MLKKLVSLLCILFFAMTCQAQQVKITFVNPGFSQDNPTGSFWLNVSAFMQAAADDLDVDLNIMYAERNHIQMKHVINSALTRKDHYIILVDEKSAATQALLTSTQVHDKIIFLLNKPTKQELIRLRARGFGILGSIVPDNYQAGRLLIQELENRVIKSKKNPTISTLALLGESATDAAKLREQGLLSYSNRSYYLKLLERVNANWSEQEAYNITKGLLQRFNNTKIIWAANDAMATGAVRAATELSMRQHILIGGINWDKDQHTRLDVSVGGHVTLGALAIIKIADFDVDNKNYIGDLKLPIFKAYKPKYESLYKAIHTKELGKIDFRYFSHTHTTPAPQPFTLDNMTALVK
ncbi:ABC transporter substrate-binding protein [Pseudoalteromonas sp. S16_S37]|uniref:ABC transporter substrate-binding protein n=1 Tax=Pseudoalteromonas sp. S16_S37 TaxID=2720228 RepID=UPI0016814863|nr:ABC transporter substrate-binding protein [Pseudoalteromonas sp. S16_S37]MBD1583089.1 substrate-binding domain-containing protein [Pseudoalteromonas sp. S16_S37]